MLVSSRPHPVSYLTLCGMTALLVAVMCVSPAQAQFYRVNDVIISELATVPVLFKQLTVIIGIICVLSGLHGFYKGLTDPRSPGMQWKKLSLILIGSLLLYISALALTAEKTVFSTSGKGDGIYWRGTTTKIELFKSQSHPPAE